MSGIYDISGSALLAQRQRLNLIAGNMANADSTTSANGTPFRARLPVFAADQPEASGAAGVHVTGVVQSQAPLKKTYDPGNPAANKQGYVVGSNVSLVRQMSDMIDATQSYKANLSMLHQGEQIDQAIIRDL
ncbi:flagellar basal body rod protein FlgC [Salinisphaera sp. RV14]|uniref:flagellar basal body rod protein FlgC n=1 Tax=unclassified Salinisphaera TaxID=2649847 RepID=UPI003F85B1B7